MKILKWIGIIVLILIALPLIVALFIPKDYAVEREIVIERPREDVFEYIKYIKNQDNYSVWSMKDPDMKKKYEGTDGTVGFVYHWDSENDEVGKGSQEIVKITEGERIDMKLRFIVPFEAEDDAYMTTESTGENMTIVTWGFSGAFPYPMNLMKLFMDMDEAVGKDLEGGLNNLKDVMEEELK